MDTERVVLQVLAQSAGSVLATEGPVVIGATFGDDAWNVPALERAIATMRELRATTHKDMFAYCYIATASSALPSPTVQRLSSQIAELCDVVVGIHEGDGFRASAVRAAVTGMALLAPRGPWPHVVSTPVEAAHFLAAHLKNQPSAETIRKAIEATRVLASIRR